jgi:hypothetical protein
MHSSGTGQYSYTYGTYGTQTFIKDCTSQSADQYPTQTKGRATRWPSLYGD